MVRQKKFLVTVFVTIILTAGAATLAVRDLDSSTADGEKTERSSSKSSTKDTSWKKNIQSEGTVDEEVDESSSSSSSKAGKSSGSDSSSDQSSSKVQQSNTLTEDDFRSSDDLAYRMIAIYGMVHGDSSWKGLASATGITMTRQSGSAPVFIATDTNGGKYKAYYRYVMSSNDTESQKQPLSFSENDAKEYRATLDDVLNYVNANGGRATVEKLNFKLVN